MAGAYSVDLRKRVVGAYQRGEGTQSEIGELFSVTSRTVQNYLYLERNTGDVLPKSGKRGRKPSVDERGEQSIAQWIKKCSELTLFELCRRYKRLYKKTISRAAMCRTCQKLSLNRKKKSLYASEQARPDIKKSVQNSLQK